MMSIDPGGGAIKSKTAGIGWAAWNKKGECIKFSILPSKTKEELYALLQEMQPEIVVCEDWRSYPWSPKKRWDRETTARLIGGIEMYCSVSGAELIMQPSNILPAAYALSGTKRDVPKALSHGLDAYCHGFYWLVKQKILIPVGGR